MSVSKNTMDGGEAILQALRNLDVDYVMSSPGSEWSAVWEAFARQKIDGRDGPAYMGCWHETLAVNLAVGYTVVTGRMQAVLLHSGVGLMQGSMGIFGAQFLGIPVVVMSGESLTYGDQPGFEPGAQWTFNLSMVGGPQRVVEPYTKWANQATSPATLYQQIIRAGEIAQQRPSGPTYVNVPVETMLAEWTPPSDMIKVPRPPITVPPLSQIEALVGMLMAADNPLITTEAAGRDAEGYHALISLAESLSIPVIESSIATYANFPKDHPLHQGFDIRPMLDEADLVVCIRSRMPWYPPGRTPANAKVVLIDEHPFKEHMVYQNLHGSLCLEGHVPSTLALLTDAINAAGVDAAKIAERRAAFAKSHDELEAHTKAYEVSASADGAINAAMIGAALGEAMPSETVYVDETTTHRGANLRHIPYRGPQSYFRVATGLGQGLGYALGIKLACPERPVVSVIGDGAFLYNPIPQSLGASRDLDLPVMIVIYNNGNYRAMRNNHTSYYPGGVAEENDLFYGAPINGPKYGELAAPFDAVGIRIENANELKDGFAQARAAIEAGRTAIVDVVMEP
ncbi:MAG: thiamine pyrophosphate-binding protein [Rhizobiales bacterium]|nr:thiamine pyrophosphate-binding protein [Hyphomicrobiales bacterium]